MKLKELKEKSLGDLHKLLADFRENSRKLRFQFSSGQLKKTRDIRGAKKTIARVLTLINSKK